MSGLESPTAGAAPAVSEHPSRPPSLPASPRPDWPAWTAVLALLLALLLAVVGALLVDIPVAAAGVKVSSKLPPGLEIGDTFVQDLAFVGAAVIMAAWGGRRVWAWQFGLVPTRFWRATGLVALTLAGFLLFTVVWSALVPVKAEKILDQLGANRNDVLLVLSAGLTTVVAPVCEEFLFRGYIFTALRNWRPSAGTGDPWVAAGITGLLFGAVHATSAPALDLVPLAVLGTALCLLYWRTGSLLPCIAAHCVNNSVAFGALEHWSWQIPVLLVGALSAIGLLFAGLARGGLITAPAA